MRAGSSTSGSLRSCSCRPTIRASNRRPGACDGNPGVRYDYSKPIVDLARDNPAAAGRLSRLMEGRGRTDEIRGLFKKFISAEDTLAAASAANAEPLTGRSPSASPASS